MPPTKDCRNIGGMDANGCLSAKALNVFLKLQKAAPPERLFLCPLLATHSGFKPQNTAASFRVFTAR